MALNYIINDVRIIFKFKHLILREHIDKMINEHKRKTHFLVLGMEEVGKSLLIKRIKCNKFDYLLTH